MFPPPKADFRFLQSNTSSGRIFSSDDVHCLLCLFRSSYIRIYEDLNKQRRQWTSSEENIRPELVLDCKNLKSALGGGNTFTGRAVDHFNICREFFDSN